MNKLPDVLDENKMPLHVAFIIDGNGRWAKKRGLSRSMGHKVGFNTLLKMVQEVRALGIKYMSVYCFSVDNWNRPQAEVDYLMQLFRDILNPRKYKKFKEGARINIMGDMSRFPEDIQANAKKAVLDSQNNTDLVLNLGLNYGGREEIVYAVNKLIAEGKTHITKEDISNNIYTAGQPDPDFIIRTSGELRLSNWMPWQSTYSEFYFPKIHWPAFNKKHLITALVEYQSRNRRFGAIKEEHK